MVTNGYYYYCYYWYCFHGICLCWSYSYSATHIVYSYEFNKYVVQLHVCLSLERYGMGWVE